MPLQLAWLKHFFSVHLLLLLVLLVLVLLHLLLLLGQFETSRVFRSSFHRQPYFGSFGAITGDMS